ncbi:MAG: hypothetical protein JO371_02435, partial [Paraburkholderia sp.]|nr:hypothetical protein [Paraburkholderia sp.]
MKTIAWSVASMAVAGLTLITFSPAAATGTVRIQQNDGSVQTYTNVSFVVRNKALYVTSADKVSTVVIDGGTCNRTGDLYRCSA